VRNTEKEIKNLIKLLWGAQLGDIFPFGNRVTDMYWNEEDEFKRFQRVRNKVDQNEREKFNRVQRYKALFDKCYKLIIILEVINSVKVDSRFKSLELKNRRKHNAHLFVPSKREDDGFCTLSLSDQSMVWLWLLQELLIEAWDDLDIDEKFSKPFKKWRDYNKEKLKDEATVARKHNLVAYFFAIVSQQSPNREDFFSLKDVAQRTAIGQFRAQGLFQVACSYESKLQTLRHPDSSTSYNATAYSNGERIKTYIDEILRKLRTRMSIDVVLFNTHRFELELMSIAFFKKVLKEDSMRYRSRIGIPLSITGKDFLKEEKVVLKTFSKSRILFSGSDSENIMSYGVVHRYEDIKENYMRFS